jgi:hypothetical protein
MMKDKHDLLRHFLAALAYRTQKALRFAPADFGSFRAAPQVRTPHELVCHMNSVLGYATTFLLGGSYREPPLPDFSAEVERFHATLARLAALIEQSGEWRSVTPEQLLQGPLADAMTHAGQLAMLRRLAGSPVPPENFVFAEVDAGILGPDQPLPAAPDAEWPEAP